MNKKHVLKYYTPTENSLYGWERYSLPIGNGYFGVSVFGRTDEERIQFTTNVFANDYKRGGVSNFAEIRLTFGHERVGNYERGLDLQDGSVYTKYNVRDNFVESKAFISYPDRVFAYRVTFTQRTSFSVRLVIPYLGEREIENGGRTGKIYAKENSLTMRGELPSRELTYEGKLCVFSDGEVQAEADKLLIKDAIETIVYFAADTSYVLDERVFLDGCHKAIGKDPHVEVENIIKNACNLGYANVWKRHQSDYGGLMSRVDLDLGGVEDGRSTETLLNSYRQGNAEPYLEETYYQYGRHLLISSSRKGTPPTSLQGVWSAYDKSPWGSGFWHNINIQMNYWPAFSTNLAETFAAYADYNLAFRKQAEKLASKWVQEKIPENYVEGQGNCGWSIGVAAFCYEIEGPSGHSGPGTGGLTTKLFWDYYDYTRDENILKDVTYPTIHSMSKFLTKCVRDYDGEYLSVHSASPEQIIGGKWIMSLQVPPDFRTVNADKQPYYHTVGSTFDQQMFYENARDDLRCAEILGVSDEVIELEKKQIEHYSPVLIGYSGQIKEFREENFYGEIGEVRHRHISQLVSLSPGELINFSTPAWQDAAKKTLELRGDESTGWALAHRICSWVRTGEGDHAYLLLQNLLKTRTHPNLWDVHPPFQIDGNFGALSGMTEMLLQSHDNCIYLLPAVPSAWENFSFKGLKARGNFTVSCVVKGGQIQRAELLSVKGGEVTIVCKGMANVIVANSLGEQIEAVNDERTCKFTTKAGECYVLSGFTSVQCHQTPTDITADFTETGVQLTWKGSADCYAVYRAVENDAEYRLLGYTEKTEFLDGEFQQGNKRRLTYKVTALDKTRKGESKGAVAFLSPATRLEKERYQHIIRQMNLYG